MRSLRLPIALALLPIACGSSSSEPAPAAPDGGSSAAPDSAPAAALTADERARLATLSPLPDLPRDTTNKYADDERAALLGLQLFFDPRYSGPLAVGDDGKNGAVGAMGDTGKLSCASCHMGPGLDDRRSKPGNVSLGANLLPRNSLGLVNASHYKWVNWAGRFSAQWELPLAVTENAANMNGDRLRVAHLIAASYRAPYEAVFGPLEPTLLTDATRFPASGKPKANAMADDGAWEKMTDADRTAVNAVFVNFGKALGAYLRKLTSRKSRFDDFAAGSAQAMTANEIAGLRVFLGKGNCAGCHKGPRLTDDDFHNIGTSLAATDTGRFADAPALLASAVNSASTWSDDRAEGGARLMGLSAMPPDATKGQFRTPSLRNVGRTAPYMHAGQLATLEDVVEYYDRGGGEPMAGSKDPALRALGLSAQEKSDLVAFLRALDMDPVAAGWTSDPGGR